MVYIIELLKRIKTDKREKPEKYTLKYYERDSRRSKEATLADVKLIDEIFVVFERREEEIYVPVHMIKEVKKGKKIIWQG